MFTLITTQHFTEVLARIIIHGKEIGTKSTGENNSNMLVMLKF